MEFSSDELRQFLDSKVLQYNKPYFIDTDPVQIPHDYTLKEDIEISAFLTATISWGHRTSILKNAFRMLEFMGNSPYDFILNHKDEHLIKMEGFVHRTFNATDLYTFIEALKFLYQKQEGLEGIFTKYKTADSLQPAIHHLKKELILESGRISLLPFYPVHWIYIVVMLQENWDFLSATKTIPKL